MRLLTLFFSLKKKTNTIKVLLVDIPYENFFLVHIVEIIVHFVLSMIHFQVCQLHVHVTQCPMILNQ